MSFEKLSPLASERICKHMNKDHQDAVDSYAKHYAGVNNAKDSQLMKVTSKDMQISVNGTLVEIPFDHPLTSSQDAHQTLIAMLKEIP